MWSVKCQCKFAVPCKLFAVDFIFGQISLHLLQRQSSFLCATVCSIAHLRNTPPCVPSCGRFCWMIYLFYTFLKFIYCFSFIFVCLPNHSVSRACILFFFYSFFFLVLRKSALLLFRVNAREGACSHLSAVKRLDLMMKLA